MLLDKKINFSQSLKDKVSKGNRENGLINRLYTYLPRQPLINIYKCCIRPHLDYGDVIYDNPFDDCFCIVYRENASYRL